MNNDRQGKQDHMREAHREGLKYGLRHIAFNPDEAMTDEQLSAFARRLCDELHADPEYLTLVVHQKDGSTHGHLILPEWQQDHVLESRFTWMRMEKVARLEEIRLGHKLVAGRHDRAIAKALRKECRHSEAEQVDALVPVSHDAKPRAAYTSQDSFFKIEDEACCDVDCRHECMSVAVISCCHPSPVFQLCEHVFDQMTLFIQMPVVSGL